MEKGLAAITLNSAGGSFSFFFLKTVSKEVLISRFFRALARNRPLALKLFPNWDFSVVLQALVEDPFEPLQEASLKDLVLKTLRGREGRRDQHCTGVHLFSPSSLQCNRAAALAVNQRK